ncbi:MAG: hypothetical protein KF810_20700 [Rhizobiaceae bacterium]|nr:hypothetical protein [Rhizobiaceae bacterium]
MILAAITLIIVALALRTRLGMLYLAKWLLKSGNALGEAGSRILDRVKLERIEHEQRAKR